MCQMFFSVFVYSMQEEIFLENSHVENVGTSKLAIFLKTAYFDFDAAFDCSYIRFSKT